MAPGFASQLDGSAEMGLLRCLDRRGASKTESRSQGEMCEVIYERNSEI